VSGRDRRRDGGTAVVEFVLLGVVLLVPLLYLALALSAVQRGVLGVTQAAREAGRAYVTGTATTAAARAEQAARLALRDQGLPTGGLRIRYGSADSGCATAGPRPWPLRPGADFAVCVSVPLRLPAVPGFLSGDRTVVTARHVVRADEYRDHSP
jgi:Flp pilus assembly protein TadG